MQGWYNDQVKYRFDDSDNNRGPKKQIFEILKRIEVLAKLKKFSLSLQPLWAAHLICPVLYINSRNFG